MMSASPSACLSVSLEALLRSKGGTQKKSSKIEFPQLGKSEQSVCFPPPFHCGLKLSEIVSISPKRLAMPLAMPR